MGIRARLWPGLTPRAVWLEVLLATLSAVAVALTGRAPDDADLLPLPVRVAGTAVLVVLLLTLRRRAPLVPFAVSVVLTALSPPVTIALLPSKRSTGSSSLDAPPRPRRLYTAAMTAARVGAA